jgi:UDP-GlcNAc:undecaprenyl-phosphate/decaprenyl-phosphate GlcNAc-1-phosphate transferase
MIFNILLLSCFVIFELLYFKLADRFNIIDKPNERSSHTLSTIRGGGIIFPIAWFFFFIISKGQYPWFTTGLTIITVVSFWDDVKSLNSGVRLLAHLIAFALCFYELGLWTSLPVWVMILLFIGCIGALNIVNFMDGINGLTGMYALSILVPMFWYSNGFDGMTVLNPWFVVVLSILVFGFFNFRKRARCFAGDVGSVSMGFLLIFLVLGLMFGRWSLDTMTLSPSLAPISFDPKYILLLAVYGVDGVLTIIQRLYNRENIFKAHRKHLYQLLVNEKRWPHLVAAGMYATFQMMISIGIFNTHFTLSFYLLFLLLLVILYTIIKKNVLKEIS